MTQKKGKIFNDPSCSRQTLEGLLWEGFHFTPPPTNQLFTSRAFLRNTHYSAASFILLEHYQRPPHFLAQQTALVRTWTFCGPDSEDLCDLGHVIYFFSFPTSIPKWKGLWAQFRSKAVWRLRAKRDKPCEFRISSLERPHQETGTESQLSTRALLFPPKGHNPSPGGSRRPGSDARSRPCTAPASPAGDPTPAHPPPRPPAGDLGGRPHPSPPPAPTEDFLEVPGRAGQAAFTNQLYAARVETSLTPRGPRSPPVRPPARRPEPSPGASASASAWSRAALAARGAVRTRTEKPRLTGNWGTDFTSHLWSPLQLPDQFTPATPEGPERNQALSGILPSRSRARPDGHS